MNVLEGLFEKKKTLKKESSKGTYSIGQSISGFHPTTSKNYSLKITDIYVEVRNKKPVAIIEYDLKHDGKSSVEEKTAEEFMKIWFGY